jgi:hypothetical protein
VFFREMLRADPKDGDAYAGLGEAALVLGNFATARADLLEASRLLGDSARTAEALAVADSALALDPTPRRMDVQERQARAARVLTLVLDVTGRCAPSPPEALADSAQALLAPPAPDSSQTGLSGGTVRTTPSVAALREQTESMLDLASALWGARGARCSASSSPAEERALALVMTKLAA